MQRKQDNRPGPSSRRDADKWTREAERLVEAREFDQALAAADKALETDDQNTVAWFQKGNALFGQTHY